MFNLGAMRFFFYNVRMHEKELETCSYQIELVWQVYEKKTQLMYINCNMNYLLDGDQSAHFAQSQFAGVGVEQVLQDYKHFAEILIHVFQAQRNHLQFQPRLHHRKVGVEDMLPGRKDPVLDSNLVQPCFLDVVCGVKNVSLF